MEANRITRVVRILTTLQSGQRYDVDELAKLLEVSRRTIFRDLRDLRRADVPAHYDKKNRCYTMDSKFFLPAAGLSAQEALSLLLLAYRAKDHIHIPFNGLALLAAHKVENNLPDEIKRYCSAALQNISVRAYTPTRMEFIDKIFVQLREAILKKRIVNLRYYFPSEHRSVVAELYPYHLRYDCHGWYVIGRVDHQGVRTFKLNQIEELNVLDKCFVDDEKFNIQEYLGKAWSTTPEGRLYNIKLKFLPDVARAVAEIQWHSTQTVTFADDGSAIVEFRVDGLNEIITWILGYGDKVKVVSPEILRLKVTEIAQNTIMQNSEVLSSGESADIYAAK